MKKIFLTTLSVTLTTLVFSQEFSFRIIAEDALGYRDTIIIGYDLSASYDVQPNFGEVNVISTPYNTNLDVRISNELSNRNNQGINGTVHLKKQIDFYNCSNFYYSPIAIDIVHANWPVTFYWNSTLFIDSCVNGSVLTSFAPGGWFDTSSPSDLGVQFMNDANEKTFSTNTPPAFNSLFGYLNGQDTVSVVWFAFGNEALRTANITENNFEDNLSVSPNPTNNEFNIALPSTIQGNYVVHLFSADGKKCLSTTNQTSIQLGQFDVGIYQIILSDETGRQFRGKIVKN